MYLFMNNTTKTCQLASALTFFT